jgi:hypothetical protein
MKEISSNFSNFRQHLQYTITDIANDRQYLKQLIHSMIPEYTFIKFLDYARVHGEYSDLKEEPTKKASPMIKNTVQVGQIALPYTRTERLLPNELFSLYPLTLYELNVFFKKDILELILSFCYKCDFDQSVLQIQKMLRQESSFFQK